MQTLTKSPRSVALGILKGASPKQALSLPQRLQQVVAKK